MNYWFTSENWVKVIPYYEMTIIGQKICLFHYRMAVWDRSDHGCWALHGHSLPVNCEASTLDVGMRLWGHAPVSFDEISEEMKKHSWVPVDGHK